jgi:hypothetical protein
VGIERFEAKWRCRIEVVGKTQLSIQTIAVHDGQPHLLQTCCARKTPTGPNFWPILKD